MKFLRFSLVNFKVKMMEVSRFLSKFLLIDVTNYNPTYEQN